ncbi:ABC transporter permease [Anaerosalibacter sp. Marseille-P3206]|uniref:ABC transporter permease n=1 Tax=Anaerosalibacter sp. Marseille-P3206 TaxID=1871005 RepID=UPI000986DE30|nr:ABC transporter permease [Anaerosalibacter sp. Marseille-P3206]
MKILRLSFVNYKRMVKDKGKLIMMLIVPLLVILGVSFTANKGGYSTDANTAFSVEDKGGYAKGLLESLNIEDNIFYNREEAMELLENNEVVAVYILPENFTEKIKGGEKPCVEAFKREEGNTTLPLEMNIEKEINKKIKEEVLLKNDIIKDKKELYKFSTKTQIEKDEKETDGGLFLVVFMIIYFTILSSSSIGDEMVVLRKQNILSRAMTTANKSYEIMGSLCLAILFLQVSMNLLVLFIGKLLLKYPIIDFHIIFINIVLASLFSITFTIFLTRIFEEQGVVSLGTVIFTVGSLFLSLIALDGDLYPKVPMIIKNLGKFVPQYWLLDSIDKSKLFPNTIVLLLMILALFTAGNFKFRDFVNRG